MSIINVVFVAFGLTIFVLGVQTVVFVPLALYYELWKKRFLRQHVDVDEPRVSVIIPAHNEEMSIVDTVRSVIRSSYHNIEIIVINDGSTDGTQQALAPFVDRGEIRYASQNQGGKARALNTGIGLATGEIILFSDADSIFQPETVTRMVRWFADPNIEAVCGNDEPLRPTSALQKLLTITTHIGSGFVRRALSIAGVLPIISGNLGAVRKRMLENVGRFSPIWGEDLDLTFKLHKAGARIVFDPEALVLCDVPATVPGLWRQRVRWMRSFLKICRLHSDLLFSLRHLPFSLYLPLNWLNMVVVPFLQLTTLIMLPFVMQEGSYQFHSLLNVLAYVGVGYFFFISMFGILLDRAYRHLKLVPLYGWLILPLSYFYNAVLLKSVLAELKGARETWFASERHSAPGFGELRRGYRPALVWGWSSVLAAIMLVYANVSTHSRAVEARWQPHGVSIAVATHFDAWERPEDAINSVVERSGIPALTTVGIEAGRTEWTFFKWQGHESSWSNDQKNSSHDLLEYAIGKFLRQGKHVVPILDVYAPGYIRRRPHTAAVDVDGKAGEEQVCFVELTDGEYGREIIAAATYLASHYEIDGVSLTEVEYSRFCYDDRCLQSFKTASGRKDWPRRFFSSTVDRENKEIGAWRSQRMAQFLQIIADSVHKYGKRFYVDVPVHLETMNTEGQLSGLFYPRLLKFVDALIVWDYFYLEGRAPSTSEDVARFFVSRYGAEKVIMSIGLWGSQHTVAPDELAEAVRSSIAGGAVRLWITPNHLMNDAHWNSLESAATARSSDSVCADRGRESMTGNPGGKTLTESP
jgi:cellulose synthase/poly-beta-1,6-N-acetylglucosamine synthase-like glycosyltransferase